MEEREGREGGRVRMREGRREEEGGGGRGRQGRREGGRKRKGETA